MSFPVEKIINGVKSVWYASATSDIKPEISSVYMYHNDTNITFVATDSFRLAEKTIKDGGVLEFEGVIMPVKNVHEIVKVLDGTIGDCVVDLDKHQISFTTNEIFVTSRVVNGIYPDYQQIIPKEYVNKATLLKNDLQNAFRKTSVFLNKFIKGFT